MKKCMLILFVVIFATALGFAQEDAGIPEKVKVSLDALLKTRTPNGFFNMKGVNTYFYASQGSVYVNVLFSAELEKDRQELKAKIEADHQTKMEEYNKFVAKEEKKLADTNRKIREKNREIPVSQRIDEKTWEKPDAPKLDLEKTYHNLFLRVCQDGTAVQKYKSPMPQDEEKTEYYSFGLIMTPGKYDILLNVNRFDDSQDGTLLIEVDVPNLTLTDIVTPQKNIMNSTPVFFKKINTLHAADKRFNVIKNRYQVTPFSLEFYPYIGDGNLFKVGETPTLTFFILGVNQPWDVEVKLDIKEGKKKAVSFKVPPMKNPYFFQPIEFKDKDKKALKAGDYSLSISLTDNNQKSRKGKIEIPFKIVD
ncbi:hypothetical protein ACFLRB_04635 [Acidobacteriota bacterium]